MARHFICTAGTSILGSPAREGHHGLDDLECLIRERIDSLSREEDFLRKLSAETNSLQAFGADDRDIVTLLVTDTDRGRTCAAELAKVISESFGCKATCTDIEGLQVGNAERFRRIGISRLYDAMTDLRRRHPMETVLNVTGGFKSVVPYMTLYGMLNGLTVAYLFERSDQLIYLPPAPLGVDFHRAASLERFLSKLSHDELLPAAEFEEAIQHIPFADREWQRSLVCREEGMVYLSTFGHMVMERAAEMTFPVLLSSHAGKALERSSGVASSALHSLLRKISEPLWREAHIDPGWTVTDLLVSKPGNVGWRAAFYCDGNTVYICELYPSHDEYQRHLRTRNRADYGVGDFAPYIPPEHTHDNSIEDVDLLKLPVELEKKLHSAEVRLEAAEARWVEQDDRISELEYSIDSKNAVLASCVAEYDNLRGDVSAASGSLSGRLRFLLTGRFGRSSEEGPA